MTLKPEKVNTVTVSYVDQTGEFQPNMVAYENMKEALAAIEEFEKDEKNVGFKYEIVNLPKGAETISKFDPNTLEAGNWYLCPIMRSPNFYSQRFYLCSIHKVEPMLMNATLALTDDTANVTIFGPFGANGQPIPMCMVELHRNELKVCTADEILAYYIIKYCELFNTAKFSEAFNDEIVKKTQEMMEAREEAVAKAAQQPAPVPNLTGKGFKIKKKHKH